MPINMTLNFYHVSSHSPMAILAMSTAVNMVPSNTFPPPILELLVEDLDEVGHENDINKKYAQDPLVHVCIPHIFIK